MTYHTPLVKRILCPISSTQHSKDALRYAIILSGLLKARLFVNHCLESSKFDQSLTRHNLKQSLFQSIVEVLKTSEFPKLEWEVFFPEGSPSILLPQFAANEQIDLVIIQYNHQWHQSGVIGSTAEVLCRNSPCPVLIVQPDDSGLLFQPGGINLKKILVPIDFSDDSELARVFGLAFAHTFQVELHFMHILESFPTDEFSGFSRQGSTRNERIQRSEEKLRNFVNADHSEDDHFKFVIREGHPYHEILMYAQEQKIDQIHMGVHGSGFGMNALFGSNVDRVLRQTPCSVLLTRPKKPSLRLSSYLNQ